VGCSRDLAALGLLAILAGCPQDDGNEEDTDHTAEDSDVGRGDTDAMMDAVCELHSWQTVGQPFLSTWCGPCHGPDLRPAQRQGAPPELVLATEDDAYQWADRIRARALRATPDMPPVPGPSPEAIARMATYLDCLYRD